ncbi:hypothetical protein P7B02_09780 [Caulobacter segnis]|uniref:hypothetical protein n=1 Tax=Caulobacter segnis TaxID=88688 RepID=UPI0024107697|nr:hypothetical protein [Caulobacter segnis]MDG2521831.1 hypothetical protein [Caulobacter segnis]
MNLLHPVSTTAAARAASAFAEALTREGLAGHAVRLEATVFSTPHSGLARALLRGLDGRAPMHPLRDLIFDESAQDSPLAETLQMRAFDARGMLLMSQAHDVRRRRQTAFMQSQRLMHGCVGAIA